MEVEVQSVGLIVKNRRLVAIRIGRCESSCETAEEHDAYLAMCDSYIHASTRRVWKLNVNLQRVTFSQNCDYKHYRNGDCEGATGNGLARVLPHVVTMPQAIEVMFSRNVDRDHHFLALIAGCHSLPTGNE